MTRLFLTLMVATSFLPAHVLGQEFSPFVMLNNGLIEADKFCSTEEWNQIMVEIDKAIVHSKKRRLGEKPRQLKRCGCKYCWFKDGCAKDIDRRRRGLMDSTVSSSNVTILTGPNGVSQTAWNSQSSTSQSSTSETTSVDTTNSTTNGLTGTIDKSNVTMPGVTIPPVVTMPSTLPPVSAGLALCEKDVLSVNALLKALPVPLSPECLALVIAPKEVTCRERVECTIDYFNLWDAANDTMLIEGFPETGGRICSSTKATFQAVPTFDIGKVVFNAKVVASSVITRRVWRGNTDYAAPYFLLSHTGTDLSGVNFPVGTYTIMAYISPNPSNGRNTTFTVDAC